MAEPLPRVLVFQPVLDESGMLDFRLLGLQLWLAERLSAIGLEGASALVRAAKPGEPELVATAAPDDAEIVAQLREHDARWGVVTVFVGSGDAPRLSIAKLTERRRTGELQVLARWRFDHGGEHLPDAALRLLLEVAVKLGHAIEPVGWDRVFDTDDVVVASNYLTALGAVAVIEAGFGFDENSAETAVRALLACVRAGMRPAIELFPRLVGALHEHERAPIELLRAAVEAARSLVDDAPESWLPMLHGVAVGGVFLN